MGKRKQSTKGKNHAANEKNCQENRACPGFFVGIIKCVVAALESVGNQHMFISRIIVKTGFPVFVIINIKRDRVTAQQFFLTFFPKIQGN